MLNMLIKTNRESADLYVMRARLHQVANRITVAYYDVREARRLDPDHQVCETKIDLWNITTSIMGELVVMRG